MCKKKIILYLFLIFMSIGITMLNVKMDKKNILIKGKKLYSQGNEELVIRDYFQDRRGGVFLDIGCADYKGVSTTYYLEKHLGWSGIAVDALSEYALGYIENRPKTRFFSFIVTDHSFSFEPFYRLIEDRGLSSTQEDYIENAAEREHVGKKYQTIYLPTITLNDLLDKNGIEKIDFLSMDIEGGEVLALAGFDIERFRPELVCIESQANKDSLLEYFTRHGYQRVEKYRRHDNNNWYFERKK